MLGGESRPMALPPPCPRGRTGGEMIFNRDLLFVHVPKAGGMALTTHLLEVLSRPVYYSVPEGHSRVTDPAVIHIRGFRHENLAEAREIMARHGMDISSVPLILAAIRN